MDLDEGTGSEEYGTLAARMLHSAFATVLLAESVLLSVMEDIRLARCPVRGVHGLWQGEALVVSFVMCVVCGVAIFVNLLAVL